MLLPPENLSRLKVFATYCNIFHLQLSSQSNQQLQSIAYGRAIWRNYRAVTPAPNLERKIANGNIRLDNAGLMVTQLSAAALPHVCYY
jgi:hypothetical protein